MLASVSFAQEAHHPTIPWKGSVAFQHQLGPLGAFFGQSPTSGSLRSGFFPSASLVAEQNERLSLVRYPFAPEVGSSLNSVGRQRAVFCRHSVRFRSTSFESVRFLQNPFGFMRSLRFLPIPFKPFRALPVLSDSIRSRPILSGLFRVRPGSFDSSRFPETLPLFLDRWPFQALLAPSGRLTKDSRMLFPPCGDRFRSRGCLPFGFLPPASLRQILLASRSPYRTFVQEPLILALLPEKC